MAKASREAVFRAIKDAVDVLNSEAAERNAIIRILARNGFHAMPEILEGKSADKRAVRLYIWEGSPAGDLALVTGPQAKGEVTIVKDLPEPTDGYYLELAAEGGRAVAATSAVVQRFLAGGKAKRTPRTRGASEVAGMSYRAPAGAAAGGRRRAGHDVGGGEFRRPAAGIGGGMDYRSDVERGHYRGGATALGPTLAGRGPRKRGGFSPEQLASHAGGIGFVEPMIGGRRRWKPGEKIVSSGYPGVIVSEYEAPKITAHGQTHGMYEIRLPGGVSVVTGADIQEAPPEAPKPRAPRKPRAAAGPDPAKAMAQAQQLIAMLKAQMAGG